METITGERKERGNVLRMLLHRPFVLALVVAVVVVLWKASEVFWLAFAALMLAVVLRFLADWLAAHSKLRPSAAFAVVLIIIAAVTIASIGLLVPVVDRQTERFQEALPQSMEKVKAMLESSNTGRRVERLISGIWESNETLNRATKFALLSVDAVAGLVAVIIVGIYFAVDPKLYTNGLLRLAPEGRRSEISLVFAEIAFTLRWWIAGQLVPMVVLGLATWVGLHLLNVPLAFALSTLTAILIFIPYVGAVISAIPAMLVGLMESPEKMLWVTVLYTGIHVVEGYVISPLVQKEAVQVPPAMTILVQLLMWIVSGFLGMAFSTPLMAASLAVIKMTYLKDRPTHLEGRRE